jgi:hypothetical protein
MVNPAAYFDCLSLAVRLQRRIDEPSVAELCLFSYLSCLLWLYKGEPVSTWGYSFVVTQQAFIYSTEIQDSVSILISKGYLSPKEDIYLHVTEEGEYEYQQLATLPSMEEREPFLEGACASLLALPYGLIRNTLQQEPDIRATIELSQSRALLTDNDQDILYDQFKALSSAIGIEINDLMIPAVVWLKYLARAQSLQDYHL